MIVDAILELLMAVLGGIVNLLPAFSLPSALTVDVPSQLASAVNMANAYFPVRDLGVCIGILLGFRLVVAAWSFASWVYDKIPGKFT